MQYKLLIKRIFFCVLALASYFISMSADIYYMSRFLDIAGPQNLPLVTIGAGLLVIAYSAFNTFVSRAYTAKAFAFILIIFAVAYLLLGTQPESLLPVSMLFLLSTFLLAFFDVAIANLILSVVTPLQAKTILPYRHAFGSLGIITASYSVANLKYFYNTYGMSNIAALILLMLAALSIALIIFFKKDFMAGQSAQENQQTGHTAQNPLSTIKEGFRFIFQESRLFRMLASVFFLFIGIKICAEFKLKAVLASIYRGDELTAIIGLVYLIQSASTFLVGLLFAKRLVFYLGIANAIISYPIIMGTVLVIASMLGLGPLPSTLFFLSMAIPLYSYVPTAIEQIFSITPKYNSNSVYFIIKGLFTSASLIIFSFALLLIGKDAKVEKYINSLMIGAMIVILLYVAIRLKQHYLENLKLCLFSNDLYLKLRAIELYAEKNHIDEGENFLRKLLKQTGENEETRIRIMASIAEIGNYQSISDLIPILDNGTIKEKYAAIKAINRIIKSKNKFNKLPLTKYLLLQKYEKMFVSDAPTYLKIEIILSLKYYNFSEVINFLEKNLSSEDPQIRINTIDTISYTNERAAILYLKPLLADKNDKVVCAVIAALWKYKDLRIDLITPLAELLDKEGIAEQSNALYLINRLNAFWEKPYVSKRIHSTSQHLRLYALLTMLNFGHEFYFLNQFIREWQALLESEQSRNNECIQCNTQVATSNSEENEFIFSQYRHLNKKIRHKIIKKIQQLPTETANLFIRAFKQSRYFFPKELDELS